MRGLASVTGRPCAGRCTVAAAWRARWLSWRRRATSRAPAGSRSGLTDCLNFGNPEKPEIAWELAEAIEGMALAAEALRRAGRLRERLALQRDRRARDPAGEQPVVGCVGLVPDVRVVPSRWREGDVVPRRGGRTTRAAPPSTSAPRPELVEFLWRAAPTALTRARRPPTAASPSRSPRLPYWSGIGADVELPEDRDHR